MSFRSRAEFELGRVWRGERPVLAAFLWPLSLLYGLLAVLHRAPYVLGLRRRTQLDVPVISIGNLVVGGAGKTPVTFELARRFRQTGRRVAILSRGYGRSSKTPVVVVSDADAIRATAEEGGDEPLWLAQKLPGVIVVVGARRAAAAAVALDLGADLVILDDGFSHHALKRMVDVLVVDADGGLGNGRLLPAGPLREPRWAARRAELAWLTRVPDDRVAPPSGLPNLALVRSSYSPVGLVDLTLRPAQPLETLKDRRVLGVCGIARPANFEKSLRETGAHVRDVMAFPDHHPFTQEDVKMIESTARAERAELIVTTEKDAMRLSAVTQNPTFRALAMELSVIGETAALDALVRRFARPALIPELT